ncbi:MAG: two pore domain potassium channel family protein [Phycisphaerae bacterium]|nr:two pore domain potassium channel family protein [Phycisphaerae bacterium]
MNRHSKHKTHHEDLSQPKNFKLLHGNPGILTGALFLTLLVYPFFADSAIAGFVRNAFYSAILISAIWALHERRVWLIVGCVLGLPWIVASWMGFVANVNSGWWVMDDVAVVFRTLRLAGHFLFLGFVTLILLGSILRDTRVTHGTLCHAVSAYILIGLVWAAGYALTNQFDQAAFAGDLHSTNPGVTWNNCVYFSFSTMTTAGFGDIVPVSTHAKSLVIVEMVVGPLYLTILVARLVALYKKQKPATAQ